MTTSNISYSTDSVITIVLWLFGFNVSCNKHGGIVEPTSRKEKGDFIVEKADSRDSRDGDLVRIRQKRGAKAYGPKKAVVVEVARLHRMGAIL